MCEDFVFFTHQNVAVPSVVH